MTTALDLQITYLAAFGDRTNWNPTAHTDGLIAIATLGYQDRNAELQASPRAHVERMQAELTELLTSNPQNASATRLANARIVYLEGAIAQHNRKIAGLDELVVAYRKGLRP